ncbi:TolC family protein [Anaeromyxobacter oryzae]|nr:TolC family protein [Anaeromyxobacter oryzae]
MTRLPLLALTLLAAPAVRAQAPAPAPATPAPGATPPAWEDVPTIPAVDFDEAIRLASTRATSAAIAAEEVSRADALLVQARSPSLPALAVNGTYTHLDSARRLGSTVTAAQDQQYGSVALSVPLFAPSRWYQWSHARDAVDVARASEADVRRSVTLVAGRVYLAILAQRRAVEVSRRAVETARAHFEFARHRRAGGVGNALDEARADQQLATSEVQLENALSGLSRAQEALGIATGSDGPLDARTDPDLAAGVTSPEDAVRAAEDARADLRAARERARAAHRVARDSWADWLPTVSAVSLTFLQDPSTSTTPRDGWQAGLVLSFPLFEGGLRTGQRRERDALDAEARSQLDGLTLQARSEVRGAFVTLRHAEAALAQARRGAERAHAALALVEDAYRAGATTSLDVVDAEQRARDADTAAVVAEDAVRQGRLDLLAATGRFP